MGDLLYLLKWLRRRKATARMWYVTAADVWRCEVSFYGVPDWEHAAIGLTPLRALRALAQQIRQQEETGRG